MDTTQGIVTGVLVATFSGMFGALVTQVLGMTRVKIALARLEERLVAVQGDLEENNLLVRGFLHRESSSRPREAP